MRLILGSLTKFEFLPVEKMLIIVLFTQNGVVSSVKSQMLWLTMKQVSYKTNPYYIKSNFKES